MEVTLAGLGCGTADTVTGAVREALYRADGIVGAARLLDGVRGLLEERASEAPPKSPASSGLPPKPSPNNRPDLPPARCPNLSPAHCPELNPVHCPERDPEKSPSAFPELCAEVRPKEIVRLLEERGWTRPCVVYSGDTGFYSGARLLLPLLDARDIPCRVLPGISCVQALSARLGRLWQDWNLLSAHGADCDAVAAVMGGKPACFLTGTQSPAALCRTLTEAGLGRLAVAVGENLFCSAERVIRTTAAEAARMEFSPLSVLLAEAAPIPYPLRTPGIPDDEFLRGKAPMTKQEVRAVALAKLAVRPTETVWDVGAGTGSVSVELALAARQGRVWAVERREDACDLIRRNRERFGAWNLTVVQGTAPEALEPLPTPDAVFLGGSGGAASLRRTVALLLARNPAVRITAAAVTLETTAELAALVKELPLTDVEAVTLNAARTRTAGAYHLMDAQNPVTLFTMRGGGGTP